MDQFIAAFPKTVVAIVVLVLGLLFLRQINPPRTICDAQIELFRETQKKFLYLPPAAGKIQTPALIQTMFKECSDQNGPGACYEFFTYLRKMVIDLDNIPSQCTAAAAAEPVAPVNPEKGGSSPISAWMEKTMALMVQMAWGERAPASYAQRNGWFDSSELTIYCSLRRQMIRLYDHDDFARWQEGMLKSMPHAELLSRDQVWQRSILSTSCDVYR